VGSSVSKAGKYGLLSDAVQLTLVAEGMKEIKLSTATVTGHIGFCTGSDKLSDNVSD